MPNNGQSIGSDVTIDVYDPLTGSLLTLSGVTAFEPKQLTSNEMRRHLDGTVLPMVIHGGWEGTIGLDRTDNEVDRYFAALEEAYYAGTNITGGSITETISNPDGTVSQYRYEGVMLRYDSAGSRTGDKVIEQSIAWQASRRKRIV